MTKQRAHGDVCLLPMNNRTCQQGRTVHSCGSLRWIAAAPIAVLALLGVTAAVTRVIQ